MPERELAWKDKFTGYIVNTITADTTGDSVDNDIVLLSDVEYDLKLTLTGAEYTKLFSACMTGADLAFPEEAHEIVWLLWKAGKGMTFCENVANCIDTSVVTQDAINSYITNTGQNGGAGDATTIVNQTILNRDLTSPDMTCDKDHKFGMSMAIVEAIHEATLEIFQGIEVATNHLELAEIIASDIPIVSLAGKALAVANWVQETAYEIYISAYSEPVRQEIACEIYCLLLDKDNCELSYAEIWDIWINEQIGMPPDSADFSEWLDWLLDTILAVNVKGVKTCQILGLLVMRYGGRYGQFATGINSFATVVQLASNDIDPDWNVLCTDCPSTWSHTFNLEETLEPFSIVSAYGHWAYGFGVVSDQRLLAGVYSDRIDGILYFNFNTEINSVKFKYNCVRGEFMTNVDAIFLDPTPLVAQVSNQGFVSTGDDQEYYYAFPLTTVTRLNMAFYASWWYAIQSGGYVRIREVTVTGVGTNPFL